VNNKSLLLNGSFFEDEYLKKIDIINNLEIKSVYVFDHYQNPEMRSKPVYEIKEAISKLNEINKNFQLGSMVLNVRKRKKDILLNDYIYQFMEIKNFNFGLGIGDEKYEKKNKIFENNIEDIICEIQNHKIYDANKINIILGGNSKFFIDLSLKYSIGLNQWQGSLKNIDNKIELFEKSNINESKISYCTKNLKFSAKEFDTNIEIIYVLSENKTFKDQIDDISKYCLN
tara:strand:- start:262 stop:948 length:687 start_codon:yes stop_codon:yes gene_type:complete